MDGHAIAKGIVLRAEARAGGRNLAARRALNAALRAGAKRRPPRIEAIDSMRGSSNVEENFQAYLRANAAEVRARFPYLANRDGTPVELSRRTRMGGDAQGSLYTFKDRPHLVLKVGPKGDLVHNDAGYRRSIEEETYVETFSVLRRENPSQTPVARAQNRLAKRRLAPLVLGAGVFDGHRVTVMQKVHDAQTLEDKYPENTEKHKRKWRRVFRALARRLESAGVCHHDLHSRNVVYGWLTDKGNYRYYLVDFDNSFFLDDAGERVCNDRVHLGDDENVAENTVFDGNASMPAVAMN